MEKKAKIESVKAVGSNTAESTADLNEQDNVDKIRDILFGNQMREFDLKFSQLEERLANDLAAMRKENTNQMDSLQTYVDSEVEILTSKLSSEEKSRIDELSELDGALKKAVKQIEQKIAETVKTMDKQSREINQKILKQSQDFSGELNSQLEQSRKRMDDYRQELSRGKVDKSVLAEMLNSLAMQLNQDEPGNK